MCAREKKNIMAVLDGSELSFLYTLALAIALWTRVLFTAPAVVSLVQYAILWPLFFHAADERDAVRFHVAHTVAAWLGSVSGTALAKALGSPVLLRWRGPGCAATATNAAILATTSAAPLSYVVARSVLVDHGGLSPPQTAVVAVVPWAVIALSACVSAWVTWQREYMFPYFDNNQGARVLAAVLACVHTVLICAFVAVDVLFADQSEDDTVGFCLRCAVVVAATVASVGLWRVPRLCRSKAARRRRAWEVVDAAPLADFVCSSDDDDDEDDDDGNDTESDTGDDRNSDDDYCEYHQHHHGV